MPDDYFLVPDNHLLQPDNHCVAPDDFNYQFKTNEIIGHLLVIIYLIIIIFIF